MGKLVGIALHEKIRAPMETLESAGWKSALQPDWRGGVT